MNRAFLVICVGHAPTIPPVRSELRLSDDSESAILPANGLVTLRLEEGFSREATEN